MFGRRTCRREKNAAVVKARDANRNKQTTHDKAEQMTAF